MLLSILFLALLGFTVSLYAYWTESKLQRDPNYKPVCDISDVISCSKPIQSKYGKLLYVSNSFIGMLFYVGIAFLAFYDASTAIFIASIGSVIASLFLAYILYFKIKTVCLVCTVLYAVNIALFVISLKLI